MTASSPNGPSACDKHIGAVDEVIDKQIADKNSGLRYIEMLIYLVLLAGNEVVPPPIVSNSLLTIKLPLISISIFVFIPYDTV